MTKWWHDLSVVKKLYAVVGLMALLIATELFTLIFAMHTLSAVRAFVVGESLWSKSQKDAIQSIYKYVVTGDRSNYDRYKDYLKIPMGDRKARIAVQQKNPDPGAARAGFIEGGNHPDDVEGMVKLLQNFYWISFIDTAMGAWTNGDILIKQLGWITANIDATIQTTGLSRAELDPLLTQLSELNTKLTEQENLFSGSLGEGSRWLENLLFVLLTLTVLTVEGTGLFLTVHFSSQLSSTLKELTEVALEVGRGNFNRKAPVRSRDELGQLGEAVNKMSQDLKANIGGRLQAESANEIKSIFVANTSHEIRSPLGIVLGFVELLKDPSLSRADHQKYLEIIEHTGRNLNRIIDDILDISKVETGHLEIELGRVDVEDFVHEIADMFQFRVAQKNNEIEFVREPNAPKHLTTDRIRMHQVLVNLIGNANKFTEAGKIKIQYGARNGYLYFRVRDTGLGLDGLQAARLFQAFSQADQSTSRRYGGTGLGLVLSKKIAKILGGDVILEHSEPGQGSVFLITIKDQGEQFNGDTQAVIPIKPQAAVAQRIFAGRKILVVDDSADNHLLLDALLSRMGFSVSSALDGREALEKANQNQFDVIFMDIQMPVMDGYDTTARLRRQNYKGPIVALTANAMKETRDRCLVAGCNDYLTKPIEMNRLVQTLERYIN